MINLYKSVLFRYIFFREINTKNATSFSRRLLFIVIFFSFILMHVQTTMAQMVEVSFPNKVQQSTLIVEAKVIQKQASWNDANTRIYTANEIEIYKVFKGQLPSGNYQIITQGGTVGNDRLVVCPSLQLSVGEIGVFLLESSTANLSVVNGLKLSPIAERQGFYKYDEISGKAIEQEIPGLKSANAVDAAGVIHTDFKKKFIRAETVTHEDFIKYKGFNECKNAGKLRLEGKDYLVNDGDVMYFRVGS